MSKTTIKESIIISPEVKKLFSELKRVSGKIRDYEALKKEIQNKIKNTCKHEDISETSKYHEGGYLNTSYTVYTRTCNICGLTSEKTKDHGTYN